MDVSDLRKRILRALDDARKEATSRRKAADEAAAVYEQFLEKVAGPLFKQAATVLRGEGHDFTVHTPAGSVRLASDRSPKEFIELELDKRGDVPQVIGRISLARGGNNVVVDEQPLAQNKTITALTETDVSSFLVSQIPRLVSR